MTTLLPLLDSLRDWTAFACWQSFLFLGLAVTLERFLRRSPWQAHWMLTAAIFTSVLGPTVSLLIFRYGGGVVSPGSIWALEKQAAGPASVLGPLILGGGFLFSLLLLHGIISARRLMFHAKPFPDRESQEALLEGSRMMRNVSLPVLFTSPAVKSPTIWSWGLHPAVLLPERLSETLTPPERDAIFLHEMAHITRRDHWAALLTRLCGVFLFWNPLYWFALKLADLAADRACDLLVLSREKVSPEIYSETLLRLAAGEKNRPVLQYLSRKEQLMKRIDTILDFEENKKAFSVTGTPMKIIGMAVAVLFLVTTLAFCQEKREDTTKQAEKPSYEKTAEELVARFAKNNFSDDGFTQGMKDGQISDIAKALWDDFQKQFGPFVQSKTLKTESLLGFKRVHEQCEFERGTAVLMVVVDKNDLVAGLFVMSAEKKEDYATQQGGYTHLVVFGPKGDFSPKTPKELLDVLNEPLFKTNIATGYFRTKPVGGKLIGSICTHDPEGLKKVIESAEKLEYVETKRLTKEMFEEHEKTRQESLPSPKLQEIEKSAWFQKLSDFQQHYVRWDENQFAADYDLTLPENESERKALEEKWTELLEGDEPVRTRYSGGTDDFTRAIVGLAMLKSPKAKELLAKIAGERVAKDNAYRHTATKMLGELGDPTAVPDLIPLVYHFNFNTRADAQISLVRLTGQNFGSDAAAWGKWYNENRNQLGEGLSEFDPATVDWSCGMNNAEIRFHCEPKNQKELDDAWLRRQGGGVKKVQSYRVDKNIADIPEKRDFSTPETAYAAFEWTMCVQEEKDYAKNLYEICVPDVKRDTSKPLEADWTKVLLTAKILSVYCYGDDRAIVVAKLEGENVRKPFNVRWFRKIHGRWFNAGNDRVDSEEDAKRLFENAVKRWAKEKPVPKIVKMEPENGAKDVDAEKTTELRVTFDIDMNTGGFSWCGGGDDFPGTEDGTPRWIDRRTCVLPVKLVVGKTYRLSINAPSYKNFQSAGGVPVEPVPYSFTTGSGEEKPKLTAPQFPPMKDIEKDVKPLPEGLLKTLKEKRRAVKNAEYGVWWFTERKNEKDESVDVKCNRTRFRFDGPKRWFADISEVMQSDVFQTGCDGTTEWSLMVSKRGTNYQTRKLEDIRDIHLSFLDPLRLLGVDDDKLEQALENRKIRYFGTEKRGDTEYHLFGGTTFREDKFGKRTTRTEIAVEAETGLPGQVRTLSESEMDFNGRKHNTVSMSTLIFPIDRIDVKFSDADFLPENAEKLQAVAKDEPDEGYDTFYVVIDDGSGGRMSVRSNGQKGTKGTSSSGLN